MGMVTTTPNQGKKVKTGLAGNSDWQHARGAAPAEVAATDGREDKSGPKNPITG